ncbi:hypothetical protein [Nitrosomonas oligotropha]|uniref:hypothetical protein n=1 Tax=Nitrosomonas oligotropha TaxID=42354 RepID=UPI002158E7BF|nr:hypothetical protein [Nitrosomonas oligotropha]
MQVGLLVEILTGEAKVHSGWRAIAIGIFIGQQAAEGIAVPLPYDSAAAAGGSPRRVEMVGVQIGQFRIHLRNRYAFRPEINTDEATRIGGFCQQLSIHAVMEKMASALPSSANTPENLQKLHTDSTRHNSFSTFYLHGGCIPAAPGVAM